ncbi:unnamed protein product [Meloidogyne enterolobii]|uniref:Uncharacterized protein n=1 Tax=Meloidogyne enterolobii TaxID=390850 RepID=A0ACB0YF48_MELEN
MEFHQKIHHFEPHISARTCSTMLIFVSFDSLLSNELSFKKSLDIPPNPQTHNIHLNLSEFVDICLNSTDIPA